MEFLIRLLYILPDHTSSAEDSFLRGDSKEWPGKITNYKLQKKVNIFLYSKQTFWLPPSWPNAKIWLLILPSILWLMSLGILITCFLDNAWILEGEVKYPSLLGVNKLKTHSKPTNSIFVVKAFWNSAHCRDSSTSVVYIMKSTHLSFIIMP